MPVIEKGKFSGQRLYQRRVELGYTMEQIATLVGCSTSAVSQWESGIVHPSAKSIYELSRALRVKPGYFFDQGTD